MPANQGFAGGHDTLRASLTGPDRMTLALTSAQTRFLRGQAHDLKAILQVGGKGLTDAVVTEIENALEHHELIKVKVAAEDRDARDAMIQALAGRSGAALVQRIGHVAIFYRPSKDHRQIVLPRA
jgi:RNA-binding protein